MAILVSPSKSGFGIPPMAARISGVNSVVFDDPIYVAQPGAPLRLGPGHAAHMRGVGAAKTLTVTTVASLLKARCDPDRRAHSGR